MRRTLMRAVLLSIITGMLGVSLVDAAGPRGRTIIRRSGPTQTVTTTVISGGDGSFTARYETITVETRWLCFRWTSTNTTLTAVLDFTGYGLNDGDEVSFAYQRPGGELEVIGTVHAVGQIATLTLSSKNGDQIPQVQEGDGLGFRYPGSFPEFFMSEDFFSAPSTTVTTCGTTNVPG